jgi:hypothetical protein
VIRRLVALVVVGLAASPATARAESARPVRAFRNSVGVNTHVTYFGTAYGNWPAVVAKLKELGVTHLRDAAFGNPSWVAGWNRRYYSDVSLAAAAGMRFDFVMGAPAFPGGTIPQLVASAGGPLRPAVEWLEAPNEYDLSGGAGWLRALRGYQRRLSTAVRRAPALRGVPLLAPTLVSPQARIAMGRVPGAVDMGNMHPYTGGETPTVAHIDGEISAARQLAGARRVVATETGYHNALAATVGQPPVPEDVAAVYTLRTLLENFAAGVRRTYLYELLDDKPDPGHSNPERNFGLLRNDFSEKPAFTALRNLLTVLGPGGPIRRRERPDLSLSAGRGARIQHVLLQRGDGSLALVLWQNGSLWDTRARRRIPAAAVRVRLRLGRRVTARIDRPVLSISGTPRTLARTGSTIMVPPDPVVIELPAPSHVK